MSEVKPLNQQHAIYPFSHELAQTSNPALNAAESKVVEVVQDKAIFKDFPNLQEKSSHYHSLAERVKTPESGFIGLTKAQLQKELSDLQSLKKELATAALSNDEIQTLITDQLGVSKETVEEWIQSNKVVQINDQKQVAPLAGWIALAQKLYQRDVNLVEQALQKKVAEVEQLLSEKITKENQTSGLRPSDQNLVKEFPSVQEKLSSYTSLAEEINFPSPGVIYMNKDELEQYLNRLQTLEQELSATVLDEGEVQALVTDQLNIEEKSLNEWIKSNQFVRINNGKEVAPLAAAIKLSQIAYGRQHELVEQALQEKILVAKQLLGMKKMDEQVSQINPGRF